MAFSVPYVFIFVITCLISKRWTNTLLFGDKTSSMLLQKWELVLKTNIEEPQWRAQRCDAWCSQQKVPQEVTVVRQQWRLLDWFMTTDLDSHRLLFSLNTFEGFCLFSWIFLILILNPICGYSSFYSSVFNKWEARNLVEVIILGYITIDKSF